MGLKDLFSSEGRANRNRAKHAARIKDKHAQSIDRQASLEALDADGSPEAIVGLLGRFSMRYDKTIEDEQEKNWVYDRLRARGESILPSLRSYLLTSDTLSFALRLVSEIADQEKVWPLVDELCRRHDNSYTRDPNAKAQLVDFLGDLSGERATQALLPYLDDVDENVRFTAIEGLFKQKNLALAGAPLIEHLQKPTEESRRIKRRILEGFAEEGWELGKDRVAELAPLTEDLWPGARLDNHGRVKKPSK